MKAAERDSFYSTLTSRKPIIIEENQLLLKLDNQVQLLELNELKADLLGFIREQLNNFAIQMNLVIEEQEQSTQLYTDTEKVKAMIEKNPVLADLMKKFNLDVGF
jgi:DNA polymerase-3 subunit gamma/tau